MPNKSYRIWGEERVKTAQKAFWQQVLPTVQPRAVLQALAVTPTETRGARLLAPLILGIQWKFLLD
jgi:hypothetical protein